MELHYKTTVWVSMKFPDDVTNEEIIERLEKGELPEDIARDFDVDYENLLETGDYITLDENDGQATIEVMDTDEKGWGLAPIWDNSYTSEVDRMLSTNNIL